MLPEKIIYVGIAINVILSLYYVKSIIFGTTRPNLVSWFMWTLAPLTGFFLQIKAGAGIASAGVFIAGFFPLITLIIFLFRKDNYWKISLFDIVCGSLAVLALIFYVFTHNLSVSIIFAILSDALAYLPTLKKSWYFPETESSSAYVGGALNNTIALSIIKNWSFAIYAFPAYLIFSNLLEICFIYRKKFL